VRYVLKSTELLDKDKPRARGRNGWFRPVEIQVTRWTAEDLARVAIYSRSYVGMPSIQVGMTKRDMARFAILVLINLTWGFGFRALGRTLLRRVYPSRELS